MTENYRAIVLEPPTVGVFGDGALTGALGHSGGSTPPGSVSGYNTDIEFWAVPPITPAVGERHPARTVGKRIVYINGIGTPRTAHAYTVKLLSVVTGASVVGIYNQSGDGKDTNIFMDLIQCLGDKTGIGDNPAVNTLAKCVTDACLSGVYLNIVAHSQGAIITSRATRRAIGRLLDHYGRLDAEVRPLLIEVEGIISSPGLLRQAASAMPGVGSLIQMDTLLKINRLRTKLEQKIKPTVEQKLHDFVSIQTFGGAARFYPDGPLYRHVYNFWDPVPNLFGQGDIMTGPGRGARVEEINRNAGSMIRDFDDHSMDGVYLQSSEYFVDRVGRTVDHNYIPIDMSMVRGG